jgi:S-adenosyl-L-methionine hydrolase (adenosine-forming)
MAVITLLSDFGLVDPYVAQMKAVILSIVPEAEIVDISHGVEKYNIASGSYLLETTLPFFPTGSIHVAVVDPGVGGPRLPIAIDCDHGTLIGPDNGLLARAADRLGFRARP